MNTDYCRSCGSSIFWCRTANGKSIPLDALPTEFGGNIVVRDGMAIVLKKGEPSEATEKRYRSHFATCPSAERHRKLAPRIAARKAKQKPNHQGELFE